MRYYFYKFARLIVKTFLAIFYPNTVITRTELLDFDNPSIIVCNHPNTLLDPLNTASRIKKHAFFLVNGSLYKSAIGNWFFTTFYCIPIERPKDKGGRKISNENSFAKCDEHLSGGGVLFIAPQGYSVIKRRIDEIKTGTARIALSAEKNNDWKLGLTILPFGLNYESPRFFRTDLLINTGDPIPVAKYKTAYEADAYAAVRTLTHDIQVAMEALIPDTKNDEEDAFVCQLEDIQQSEIPLSMESAFKRSKQLIQQLHQADATDLYNKIKTATLHYKSKLDQYQVKDHTLKTIKEDSTSVNRIINGLLLVLGFPFFLYGAINNVLLAGIPAILPKIMNISKGYDSNIKTVSGMVLWPILYWLQIKVVYNLVDNIWIALLYGLSIYPLGVFAWKYKARVKDVLEQQRAKKLLSAEPVLWNDREKIIEYLKQL